MIRVIQCPSGETCYADECVECGMCMHADEVQQCEQQREEIEPGGTDREGR